MDFEKAFRAKVNMSLWYPRAVNEMRMFKAAAEKANSIDPVKVAAALEGLKFEVLDGGEGFMRKDDHQFFQPIYISSFGKLDGQRAVRRGKHRLGLASGLQGRHAADHGVHDLQDDAAVITKRDRPCPGARASSGPRPVTAIGWFSSGDRSTAASVRDNHRVRCA